MHGHDASAVRRAARARRLRDSADGRGVTPPGAGPSRRATGSPAATAWTARLRTASTSASTAADRRGDEGVAVDAGVRAGTPPGPGRRGPPGPRGGSRPCRASALVATSPIVVLPSATAPSAPRGGVRHPRPGPTGRRRRRRSATPTGVRRPRVAGSPTRPRDRTGRRPPGAHPTRPLGAGRRATGPAVVGHGSHAGHGGARAGADQADARRAPRRRPRRRRSPARRPGAPTGRRRPGRTAPSATTIGTGPAGRGKPIPRSSQNRTTPSAAASPNADPPVSTQGVEARRPAGSGSSRAISRVAGAPPRDLARRHRPLGEQHDRAAGAGARRRSSARPAARGRR